MTFFGIIVYLRPCSVICGPYASRSGRKWHYAGANKQYSLKKSCYSLIREVKGPANVATLLQTNCCRRKCFSICPRAQHLLRTQILCPGHKKGSWFCSETFCVRNKCFPVCTAWKHNIHFVSRAFARPRNIMSNNVSAKNVSSFARALSMKFKANGKRQKWNICRLFSAVWLVEWTYLYLQRVVGDVIPFLCFIYGLEEKSSKSEVISVAVCRLLLTSCLTSLLFNEVSIGLSGYRIPSGVSRDQAIQLEL